MVYMKWHPTTLVHVQSAILSTVRKVTLCDKPDFLTARGEKTPRKTMSTFHWKQHKLEMTL